jgi:hypothetical protein
MNVDVDSPAALASLLAFAKPGAALGADGHAAIDRDHARALFTEES